jgi:hypothetical protein
MTMEIVSWPCGQPYSQAAAQAVKVSPQRFVEVLAQWLGAVGDTAGPRCLPVTSSRWPSRVAATRS